MHQQHLQQVFSTPASLPIPSAACSACVLYIACLWCELEALNQGSESILCKLKLTCICSSQGQLFQRRLYGEAAS